MPSYCRVRGEPGTRLAQWARDRARSERAKRLQRSFGSQRDATTDNQDPLTGMQHQQICWPLP